MVEARKFIVVDAARCVGCRSCEIACSLRFTGGVQPAASRITVIRNAARALHMPEVCRQCADPYCAAACPVNALRRDGRTGAVVLHEEDCIGCRMCIPACPFGSIGVDPERGALIKCDLCGGDPACVPACPCGALAFESPRRTVGRHRRRAALRAADAAEGGGDARAGDVP